MEKRLEGCEAELRGKEDDLFLQLERSLRLEEEVERAKVERDSFIAARDRLDQQRETTLRRLQLQLAQNEATRQSLERARQDVIRQATVIRAERDALEKEVRKGTTQHGRPKNVLFKIIRLQFEYFSTNILLLFCII